MAAMTVVFTARISSKWAAVSQICSPEAVAAGKFYEAYVEKMQCVEI